MIINYFQILNNLNQWISTICNSKPSKANQQNGRPQIQSIALIFAGISLKPGMYGLEF
jgi:hypothetical protein